MEGGPSNNYATRAEGVTFIKEKDTWFEVPDNLIEWLDDNLPEECKKNGTTLPKVDGKSANQAKGTTNFTLAMPGNDILIVPIYQGKAGMVWDLYMKNDTYDEKIWTKSEGIMVRSAEQSTGQTAYSNTRVGDAITINNVAFRQMSVGNGDFYVPIYDALKNAGFDPSKEWFSVTVSGVKNTNGSSYTGSGGIQVDWKTVDGGNFNNGNKTIDVKNEEVLQAWKSTTSGEMQLRLAIWQNTLNTSAVPTITIQRYQKTSTGTDYTWSKLTATNFDDGHTIGKHIKTNAIRINREKFAGQFELYLKITTGSDSYADKDKEQSSKDGQMIAITSLMNEAAIVEATRNEVIRMFGKNEYEIMFLGCEDANKSGSDWDMNDVCFLIIGRPDMPPILEGEDKYYSKRYLIEDLGSTFDFDFNDIVVDVEEVVCTHTNQVHKRQTATLKHLCGTIPFQIGFGNIDGDMKWFEPMPGNNNGAEQGGIGYTPTGSPYSSMLVETDNLAGHWDRNNNNIYVRVWPSQAGATPASNAAGSWTDMSDYLRTLPNQTIAFPKDGEYPYIIATDQNIHWMRELITIPTNWFTVVPKNDNPQYGQGETPTTPETTYYAVSGVTGINCSSIELSSNEDIVDGKYPNGATITLSATAPDQYNYEFLGWFKDDAVTATSTTNPYEFTLSATTAGAYTAKFDQKNTNYTLGDAAINFALKTQGYSVIISGGNGFPTTENIGTKTYRMTLNFSGAASGATLHILNRSWGAHDDNGATLNVNNDGTATYTVDITSANINKYAGGFIIQRNGNSPNLAFVSGSIAEVTSGNEPTPTVNEIWSGNTQVTWSNAQKISYNWNNVTAGTVLIAEITVNNNDAEIRFGDNNWTALPGTKNNAQLDSNNDGNIPLSLGLTEYRLTLTQEMINQLKNSAGSNLAICGKGFNLTKVSLSY